MCVCLGAGGWCVFGGVGVCVCVGWGHTVRGSRPGGEAAGGAVMAVRVPVSSPFTVLPKLMQGI